MLPLTHAHRHNYVVLIVAHLCDLQDVTHKASDVALSQVRYYVMGARWHTMETSYPLCSLALLHSVDHQL